jgi:integrase
MSGIESGIGIMTRRASYLKVRPNGMMRYCRDYPTKLQKTFTDLPQQFNRELGLHENCSDSDFLKAMGESSRAYDLKVKTLSNSDPEAYTESELKMAVEEVLRQRKVKEGGLAHVAEQQYQNKAQWEAALEAGEEVPSKTDIALEVFPEMDDIIDDSKRRKLTFKEEVIGHAWKAAQTLPKLTTRQTMREAWKRYALDNNINVSSPSGKSKQQRFERVIKYTGDFIISSETKDEVQDRIQNFITNKRHENPSIKAQSLKRELGEFIAAIRYVPRIDWGDRLSLESRSNNFQIPKETPPLKGKNLSDDELRLFFRTCLTQADSKWTALLVAAHAGISGVEIRRLRVDKDLYLNAKYPHIIFRGGDSRIAKTDARPRVVPIVIGLEVIKEFLPQTIKWMNSVDPKSPNQILNKRLRKLLGAEPDIKTHMFRHTWLRLSRRARISEDNKHAIAGWEHGDRNNTVMERVYDAQGYTDDPELLKQLYDDQKEIFSRFTQDLTKLNNVVRLG